MILSRRPPDFVIGDPEAPYLLRWYLIPRNRWFNVYLHKFLRSDEDRALHDHPWWWVSLILRGRYLEHTPSDTFLRRAWRPRWGRATALHRVELFRARVCTTVRTPDQNGICRTRHSFSDARSMEAVWTIFITGPRVREWGFACPNGWRHWRDFCGVREDGTNSGTTGRGCA
ncbi:hypothetical protein AA103196_2302 [Ameyamaea chiangmaiensis NBRC 103196]|uniref:Cysteine dioxygenase type I n=1 Tax=Ameyamaea chiangmaiensis TaxID=442969 RepID=A0A850P8M0_9PROT|nr:hypothetical protein [Ameyamaea chiangmaiensis]MBS4075438.1 hypothetical protein [Ameyamaea chiangmaiensis]NVN39029.1 hypothetical protein [Ameyamaea chiangmaiensis]GBQ69758.1 hypothetical protein AA103196_2302 [Ameyamaea chiangmaiensis NBRC 103196]